MRHEVFQKFELAIKIIAPILSIIFTSKLMIEIIGIDSIDKIILVFLLSIIVNVIELWAFYIGKYYNLPFFTGLGFSVAIISVLASLGYLQVNFERSIMESTEYQLKLDEINLLKNQINQLDDTAQKQRSLNHVTRSQETLNSKTPLLNHLGKVQDELESIKVQGAGIGGALYRIFANIFKVGTYWVAIIFNLFVGALIECAAVQSNIRGIKKNAENLEEKDEKKTVILAEKEAEKIPEKNEGTPEKKGVHVYRTPEKNDEKKTAEKSDEKSNKSYGKKSDKNWTEIVRILTPTEAAILAKSEGVSDPVILAIKQDNPRWGYERVGKEAGRLMDRKKAISKTYVKKVILRELKKVKGTDK